MKFKKRVYGIVGIKSVMSNWNADFTGRPKTTSKNQIFGSDKALKFPVKKMWENEGKPVLFIRSLREKEIKGKKADENKIIIQPRTLQERYDFIFSSELKQEKDTKSVIKNLFSAIDVMNFGATFAEGGQNLSITGAVQIGQGLNLDDDSRYEIQDILSPFRNSNSKSEDSTMTTIGTKTVVDEAHYCYGFVVNPNAYNIYEELVDEFEGYSKEGYEAIKDGFTRATTVFATNSKVGCSNEYSLFVEIKENSMVSLPPLDQLVEIKNIDGIKTLDMSQITELIKSESIYKDIEKIEFYYNPMGLAIKGIVADEKWINYNIYAKEAI